MAKKDKKEKKGGLLGRLFGGGKGEGGDEATPPAQGGGDERTIAPGYSPGPGEGDMTMAPGYVHASPEKSGEIGHVSFGTGRFPRPGAADAGAPPPAADPFADLDAGAAGRTMAPDYGVDDDDLGAGELTMAPGYAGPELTAPKKPAAADPFADLGAGELTMAPGYAGPERGAPKKPADPFADFGGDGMGELTMAPGYAGAPAGKPPAADPFADFGGDAMGERTMAPGYAGPELSAPKKPVVDPFADLGGDGLGDLTMAPGYAGAPAGKAAASADPFADLTMAPGYAGAPAGKPARGGGPRTGEPFVELDPGDLTMAPGYAPSAKPAAADPFADLEVEVGGDPGNRTMAPVYAQPGAPAADPFDIDLGGPPLGAPPATAGAPVIPEDAFSFEPAVVAAPPSRPGAPVTGGEPFDPFGPALLDDPFAAAPTPAPPRATPTPAPVSTPPALDDDDFRGERTMVDLTTDVDMLATLESTDELPTPDTPPPVELEGALELGEALPPPLPAAPPPIAPALVAAPARPAARARPLFQGSRPEPGGTRHVGAAAEVVLDAARGLVFAPAVEGGWTGVPAGFHRLSDGAVVGRGRVQGRDVVVATTATPPATGDDLRLAPFPAEVKVDRATRAVLWPASLEDQLAWRPPHLTRVEGGLLFVLPAATRFEDDGAVVVPASSAAPTVGSSDPTHGRVVSRLTYLGVVEEVHEDGWARLTLPAGAAVEADRVVVPGPVAAADRAGTPPLLRPERLPDGRLALPLPAGARAAGDALWVPPSAAPAADVGEPWADRDAAVVESRTYAGVREDLLDDGWVRLELPVGARVERAAGAARVVIPPEYARLGDPAALLELDRLPCGSLTFDLPPGAECLGWRVLVPPTSASPERAEARPAAREAAREAQPGAAEPVIAEVRTEKDPEPPSRKMKALDMFRKDKKKPQNDTLTFDGVLRSESTGTGGAVALDVPVAAPEPAKPEVVAAVEEPAVVAAEAAPADAEASADAETSADAATAATGAFALDDVAAAPSTGGLEAAPLEPEVPEPAPLEPDLGEPSTDAGDDLAEAPAEAEAEASRDEAAEGEPSGGDEGGPRKTGRRKRKKGK